MGEETVRAIREFETDQHLPETGRVSGQLVARMGGDEFVILVEGTTSTDDVTRVADTALAVVAEPVHIDGHELTVSASIGIVEQSVAHSNPSELMRAADITLNWAKSAGATMAGRPL